MILHLLLPMEASDDELDIHEQRTTTDVKPKRVNSSSNNSVVSGRGGWRAAQGRRQVVHGVPPKPAAACVRACVQPQLVTTMSAVLLVMTQGRTSA